MTCTALIRPIRSVAWELRTCWARGLRVSLSLDDRCERARIEGYVRQVSATDAFVAVGATHVPLDAVLAVHRPSLLGDSTADPLVGTGAIAAYRAPQDEELPGLERATA